MERKLMHSCGYDVQCLSTCASVRFVRQRNNGRSIPNTRTKTTKSIKDDTTSLRVCFGNISKVDELHMNRNYKL
jgi:hypothetical protein